MKTLFRLIRDHKTTAAIITYRFVLVAWISHSNWLNQLDNSPFAVTAEAYYTYIVHAASLFSMMT